MTTKPRKIVGIISFMNAAGAQEALLRVARHMRARGYQMEVWFLYEEDSIHALEPHIRVFAHQPRLSVGGYISVFFRLCKALKDEKPDAAVGFLPLGNVFGMTAAWLAGVPLRVASQRAPGNTFGSVMRKLDRFLGTTKVYEHIICVSHAVKASFGTYPQSYRNKLSVVHNGIEWTAAPVSKEAARKALGLPNGDIIFGAVGRMKVQKNYPFLLEVFATLPAGLLVIAGDGLLRPQLVEQAAQLGITDRVIFVGALDRVAMRDFYCATDVFVQSSLYEGQSNAVLEAMHQGLPMVLSDIPEQRETIVDEESGENYGILAPLDDHLAWATALASLYHDGALRTKLATGAQNYVNRRFTLEQMIDGFERALATQEDPSGVSR